MKNKFSIFSLLFLLAGLGIIIAAFFLFLREIQEEKLFYLNMVATCFVFITIFVRAFDIFGHVSKVASSGSSYGLRWYGVRLYTPLALLLIILSIVLGWSFNPCLIGHLVLIFILLTFFFLGSIVKTNVNTSIHKIEERKSGLNELTGQIAYLEMQCKLNQGTIYLDDINLLKENVRYITASDSEEAIALEKKLIEKIKYIAYQIEHSTQIPDAIHTMIAECMTLIELRKKQY